MNIWIVGSSILVTQSFLCTSSYALGIPDGFKEEFFQQPIDHFNFESVGSFSQRYLVSEDSWSSGPIFFYTGNEGDISSIVKGAGFLMEQAPKFQALVVFAEHRYYGKSLPYGNKSLEGDNVGYLEINQVLADYAYLAMHLKETYCQAHCALIVFGASYGGILAAYMRYKYPNIVDGALSSSAPMYSNVGYGNRSDFFKFVTEQFENNSKECVNKVRAGFAEISDLARYGKYDEIAQRTRSCSKVSSANLEKIYGWIRTGYTILSMWNFPYESNLLGTIPAYPIKVACRHIVSAKDNVNGVVLGATVFYNATTNDSTPCYDFDNQYYKCSDPTGCGPGEHGQAWDYQCCTEMIMPGGSNNITDMFPPMPFTLGMRDTFCEEKWGVKPRNEWSKIQFWGKDIFSAKNVIFSNGDLDPWGIGGVHTSPSPYITVLEVHGGAHHLDLRSSNPKDPQSVIDVREAEITILSRWIEEARRLN